MAHLRDPALVVAVARGHEDALAEIYRRHGPRVRALLRHLCDDHEAEDVVQDVFVRLWHEPQRFDAARGSLGGFLLLQARSRAIDGVRSSRARRERECRVRPGAVEVDTPVESEAIARRAGEHVRVLLARLPSDERDAITLAFLGGHSYREVAALLGQPEGTVKTRIRRGLASLRAWIPEADSSDQLRSA